MDLMNRLASLPGVGSVTFSENGLFSGTESATAVATEGFEPSGDADRTARFDHAGPGYFTTVGISLLAGRDLAATDRQGAPGVTVINQTMARFYFPSRNPIGRHIRVNADEASGVTLEVVGVARDALDHSFRQPPVRRFYVSYLQPIDGITTANFEIRTSSAATAIFPAVRQEVARFNPNLQILSLKSATALMDEDVGSERLIARLSSFFGALAVLLAVIGLYGVMSYTVARRTNEIGLRMALGARRLTVARMIVGELVVLVALGAAVGVLGGLALTRYVSSLMFGLTPGDPPTFAGAAGLLLIVGLVAAYLPARRAARIDPLAALRYE
jgi:predicted permease